MFYANLKTAVNDSIDVGPSVTELEIDNLLPFHNHSFEVAASTSKGMGPRGSIAFTFTDEYRKKFFFIHYEHLMLVHGACI